MHRFFFLWVFCAALVLAAPAAVADKAAAAAQEAAAPPAPQKAAVPKPVRRPQRVAGDAPLQAVDVDETQPLPKYPKDARVAAGKPQVYAVGEEDTLIDVARHFRLGYIEARAANQEMDPWTPVPGQEVVIPSFRLLPRAPQKGIVVNLAQMRLYYFKDPKKEPLTFPIGIGREGLQTPTGVTAIVRKAAGPIWFPTDRMREEKPYLPKAVPAGPSNPLGSHALYLGWPTFLIHGSNKPWAIGRRVSSGCMRMYPEDIRELYRIVPVGTKVTIVDQPILAGWVGDELYFEANPSKTQGNDLEIEGEFAVKGLSDALKKVIADAAGDGADRIDWAAAQKALEERRGYPVVIADRRKPAPAPAAEETVRVEHKYNFN